ncbi:MAG: uracil-DNA glycosylase family protein [Oxalobacteraceae bacterium]|nr:MAG: uracil-DNA glycosylase family protein [Oxalobacteraceae bacterium]
MAPNLPADDLQRLADEVRQCRACAEVLPLGPRPVFQISPSARILIASQAPGTRAHESGVPFSDASGEQLRRWMGVSAEEFYDSARVAIVPMAFCYPGRGASGDAPPRRECAALWRGRLLAGLADLKLTLLVGSYAQEDVLGPGRMTDRVRDFETYLPGHFPLPHPSWRSRHWAAQHPWFEKTVLPRLREEVAAQLRQ